MAFNPYSIPLLTPCHSERRKESDISESIILRPKAEKSQNTVIPAQAEIFSIAIIDTGHGIDPKDLPHIFEPFFTKKDKGTGLGLAITKGIIEKHGGKIEVKSHLNQGTIFKIQIPI